MNEGDDDAADEGNVADEARDCDELVHVYDMVQFTFNALYKETIKMQIDVKNQNQ